MRTYFIALMAAGCFSPKYQSGNLHCPDQRCPSGYHCAVDGTCWQNGSDPLASSLPDLWGDPDGGAGDALPPPDDAHPVDLTPPGDLAIPPPLIYPPASVWIAGSGGSGVGSVTRAQLNLCIGGAIVAGSAAAVGGASINYGYFSSGTK